MATARRFGSATVVVLGAVLLTTGCTASSEHPTVSVSESQDWADRMDVVLRDPSGLGGGSGLTPGSVDLGSMKQGTYELVAACTGVAVVHVTAKAGGKLLAETDVPCGAAITAPMAVAGPDPLEVRATTRGAAGSGAFWIGVNGSGWKQSGPVQFG